jgi:hypothetical protein
MDVSITNQLIMQTPYPLTGSTLCPNPAATVASLPRISRLHILPRIIRLRLIPTRCSR